MRSPDFATRCRPENRCATYPEGASIVYRVYPALFFTLCVLSLLGGIVLVGSLTSLPWLLLLVPIPAVVIGYVLMLFMTGRTTWFLR